MLFGQHKMIFELEKRLSKLEANQTRPSGVQDPSPSLEMLVPASQQ
jgi:hypothetical protein